MDALYQLLEKIGYTHPIHPPLTHMPIGLVVGALILGLTGWWRKRPQFAMAARYCMVIALIFLFPTILTGYMDWRHYYAGAWLFPIKIKLILTAVLLILLPLAVIFSRQAERSLKSALFLYTLCFFTVFGLGYYGGQLVRGAVCLPPSEEFRLGARMYHANCGACHPAGGNLINPQLPIIGSPQLADFQTFLLYNRKPRRPDGSRGIMPPFPEDKISDQQLQELYDYIINVLARPRR